MLLAGSAGEGEFLTCWQQLARGCPSPTAAQVANLERQTTPGAPLALVRRFLQEGRNLSQLKQPAKAWVYFARACRNQTQPARASPRQPGPRPVQGNRFPNLIDLHHQHPRSRP
ncbi:MAG: hypothetical protein IT369_22665 [Candidatus Latescibacteria bacterium]|nr:hypothetical protein [Candidatus Latescibacterota bacterium]